MLAALAFAALTLQAPPAQSAPAPALVVPVLTAPARDYVAPGETELASLKTGVGHYQRGEYDQALQVFQLVTKDNPASAMGWYELALTYVARKEFQNAIDAAARGTELRNPELARTYSLIGSVLDMTGAPQRALEVYRKGLEFAPAGTATLHYNMAVTFGSQQDVANAKASAKLAALSDPTHPSAQLMLAKLFLRDDLRAPGLFAAGRFLILEPASNRIQEAYTLWMHVISGNLATNGQGGTTVTVNPNQSKDEGDLTKLDLHISLSRINAMAAPGKTEIQRMVDQVDTILGLYSSSSAGKDSSTFLWTYYMPYFLEMKSKSFVEPFVYYISQRTPFPGVREWLGANQEKVAAFLAWSKAYSWPKPAAASAK